MKHETLMKLYEAHQIHDHHFFYLIKFSTAVTSLAKTYKKLITVY